MSWMRNSWIIIGLIIILSSLPILVLIESSLKYALWIFTFTLIGIILLLASDYSKEIQFVVNIDPYLIVNIIQLVSVISLFLMILFEVQSVITLVLGGCVIFFSPGYSLLRIIRSKFNKTWVEWPVYSFVASIGITPILFLISLNPSIATSLMLSALLLLLPCVVFLKDFAVQTQVKDPHQFEVNSSLTSISAGIWISTFLVFTLSLLYPLMPQVLGLDITRHLASTKLLVTAPDAYQSVYPWFHSLLGSLWVLSSSSDVLFLTVVSFVSLMIVPAFYVMACWILKPGQKRISILSTMIFSIFSGFGWTAFTHYLFIGIDSNVLNSAFRSVNGVSYWDIGYGQSTWLWFWFRPITLAFLLLFAIIAMIHNNDFPRPLFMILFTLAIITLGFIHIPELLLVSAILVGLTLFSQREYLRMHDATTSALIGCAILILISWLSSIFGGVFQATSSLAQLISFAGAIISFILVRVIPQNGLYPLVDRFQRYIKYIVGSYGIFYIASFLVWFINPFNFTSSLVSETHYVPLILLPVLFGVLGLFSILCFTLLWNPKERSDIYILTIIFIASLALGTLVSIVNIYSGDLGYGARRFLPICFAVTSILSAIILLDQIRRLNSRNRYISAFVISLIVISGTMSTNINLIYWSGFSATELSQNTNDAINFLSSPETRNPRTPILTVTDFSRYSIESVPSPYMIDRYRYPIWESQSPELPLMLLQSDRYLPSYVYIDQRDRSILANQYISGYVTNHLSKYFIESYSNPEVSIYEVPAGSPPSPISDAVLVVDDYEKDLYLYALDLLSFGNYEFTTCISSDLATILRSSLVITASDNLEYENLIEALLENSDFTNSDKQIVVVNSDGFGPIANKIFNSVSTDTIHATSIVSQDRSLELPSNVVSNKLTTKPNTSIIASYYDGTTETPLAVRSTIGATSLIYLNLFPISNSSHYLQEWASNDFTDILGNIFSFAEIGLELHTTYESWIYSGNTAMFDWAEMKGNIILRTPSMSALDFDGFVNVSIEMGDYNIEVPGIQAISVSNGKCNRIQASNIIVKDGFGFYSRIAFSKVKLFFEGTGNELTLITNQNDTLMMPITNRWVSIDGYIEIVMRNPVDLHVTGITEFASMYSLFDLYPELRSSGHNLTIGGILDCNISASNTYTFFSNVVWSGAEDRTPSFYAWEESNSIILTILVAAVIGIPLLIILRIKNFSSLVPKYTKVITSYFNQRRRTKYFRRH